ncbi:MAG TPA: CAP domain-containing protein [Lachnospiraceae bacterium]|nr:CAP domain-containing protein [Lachnospiraceae bacterium]
MKKFLKAVKLFGIAATASFAVLAVVYFFETRTVAGSSEYKAVAVDYTEAASVKETEAVTTVKTVEETKTETVKETVKEVVTEEVTEAQTEPATVKATEPQTAAPAVKAEPQTTPAPTAPAVKAEPQTAAPAAQTSLTNVVYKDAEGSSHNYATLDEAKASIKVATLSDSEAKAAAKANKTAYASLASEVVNLINEYRTANGLAKLTVNDTLSTAAMHRAAESAYADWNMTAMEGGAKRHIRPNFTKASTIASEYGIGGNFGENFGRWQASPSEIIAQWKSSSSHNALLLSGSYTKFGIGVAQDSLGDYYWVALFN